VKKKRNLLEEWIKAVVDECSYVGGDGSIEHHLWESIKGWEKAAKQDGVTLPDRESIEITREDWV
jgi:hypothetical protein